MTSCYLMLSALLLSTPGNTEGQTRLSVRGRDLIFGEEKVYLSGVNQAWVNYARDFGHGDYQRSRPVLMKTLDMIASSGGNSLRVWTHIDGSSTPQFDTGGFVTGLDQQFVHDVIDLLAEAGKRNILITLVLWNCAIRPGPRLSGLIYDPAKLQSYVDNALRPLVRAVKDNPALAMWEIVNEPEGSVAVGATSPERCHDTTSLHLIDFADWTGASIPLQYLQRFIGQQAAAIHDEDSKALVTVGAWTYKSVTNNFERRNFYSDHCLQLASGRNKSHLDLYQIHTYSLLDVYLPNDPFKSSATIYSVDKPLIIGEFSQRKGGGLTSPQQYLWGYTMGYSGTWAWSVKGDDSASDSVRILEQGMRELRGRHNQSAGGTVNFIVLSNQTFWSHISTFFLRLLKLLYALLFQ